MDPGDLIRLRGFGRLASLMTHNFDLARRAVEWHQQAGKAPTPQNKVISCFDNLRELVGGRIPAPRSAHIFLTDRCNHRCRGCSAAEDRADRDLDPLVLTNALESMRAMGVVGINYSGGGEPLLYPHFKSLVEQAAEMGFVQGLQTNLSLLPRDRLLTREMHYVRVALDAPNAQIYKMVRGVDAFDATCDRIAQLVTGRGDRRRPTIGLKYLICGHNCGYGHIREAIRLARVLKVNYIQFKMMRGGVFGITPAPDVLEARITDAMAEITGVSVYYSLKQTEQRFKCFEGGLRAFINADARMYLCAAFRHRREAHVLGDLREQGFDQIWGSDRHYEALNNLDPCQCSRNADLKIPDCAMHNGMEAIMHMLMHDPLHLSFF